MKVVKFGGSSLASGKQIEKVLKIIKADPERKIVVVSAPGKRFPEDTKVTDLLISFAHAVANKEPYGDIYESVLNRYQEIADDLELDSSFIKKIKQHFERLVITSFRD